ncbi:hypothetical protein [Streptomyces sp. Tue6028]|uniref:hypothetical protein n=1 Tax=Streptomyces sp. Tue6028 TaxID=2036037 RepID=UPI003EB79442
MSTEVKSDDELVARPTPLGIVRASETALFIAAPLLTAGSLSLIGVVCADADKIRLAGPTLLLLVTAVILLLLSIQLGFHARQWIYSYEDLQNWTGLSEPRKDDLEIQRRECVSGEEKLERAGMVYNAGTVLLAFGVAMVLVPRGTGDLAVWRWAATILVAVASIAQVIWTLRLYDRRVFIPSRRQHTGDKQALKKVEVKNV